MTFSIGSIVWPVDNIRSIHVYIGFLVKVLDALNIEFVDCGNDPLLIAKCYLEGSISDEQRSAATAIWWSYIDEQDALQDFYNRDVLMARLAICLLSIKDSDVPDLGENLSWFLEVLGFLGADLDRVIEIMENHFKSFTK